MRITKEQTEILDALQCVRLSSDISHLREVDDFCNSMNESLADNLANDAYSDDESGNVAYYLVKDSNGNILFYFSLKCGMLYDQLYYTQNIIVYKKMYSSICELVGKKDCPDEDRALAMSLLEKMRAHKGISKAEIEKLKFGKEMLDDISESLPDGSKAVGRTFAGVELVHFVANENYRNVWSEFHMPQKLGTVVFWQFVVPKVVATMEYVGCQYLFLFAADKTEDNTLVNYYKSYLQFNDGAEGINVTVPEYDFLCKFMYQETATLSDRRKQFFENFNPSDSDV